MFTTFFQSIGIVFSCVLVIAFSVITIYLVYILGVGILLIVSVYVVYYFIKLWNAKE